MFREVPGSVPGRCSGEVFRRCGYQWQTWCRGRVPRGCSTESIKQFKYLVFHGVFRQVFRGGVPGGVPGRSPLRGVPEVWLSLANVVQGGCSTEVFREMFHGGVPRNLLKMILFFYTILYYNIR